MKRVWGRWLWATAMAAMMAIPIPIPTTRLLLLASILNLGKVVVVVEGSANHLGMSRRVPFVPNHPGFGTPSWKDPHNNGVVPSSSSSSSSYARSNPNPSGTGVVVVPRGGGSSGSFAGSLPSGSPPLVKIVGAAIDLVVSAGKILLPAVAGIVGGVVRFYRALPIDAITAQIGLVYCFLGGYYPTLFSSLQAARYCGWHIAVDAIADLTAEATRVLDELDETTNSNNSNNNNNDDDDDDNRYYHYSSTFRTPRTPRTPRDVFLHKANVVLKTVDPVKINEATGALYTTWLGVSTVLQKEYARTISLALALAEGLEHTLGALILAPVLRLATPHDYRQWVPAVVGWTAKAMAMRVAWRIERVLTAATSALAGGAIVARSVTRMVKSQKRNRNRRRQHRGAGRRWGVVAGRDDDDEDNYVDPETDDEGEDNNRKKNIINDRYGQDLTIGENMLGFAVGGVGFYAQMECQYKRNFSFVVPFPWSLATWPFDLAERWIQWYITKY